MKSIKKTIRLTGMALTAVAASWIATGTAAACAGPQRPSLGSAFAPNLKSMAQLAALAGTGGKSAPQASAKDVTAPTIVGLWHLVVTADGQTVDEGFETYHADGTEMLVDLSPPATDNVCIGTWVQTNTFTYQLVHPSWYFDMNGNLLGTVMIKATVTVSRDGNSFAGTSTVDVYDLTGAQVDHSDSTESGTRIKPI